MQNCVGVLGFLLQRLDRLGGGEAEHLDLAAFESIGMHFGTFQLTTEGIDEPLRALEEARRVRKIPQSRFRTLGFGESMRL